MTIDVRFGPCDPLNPGIGYELEIQSRGSVLLFTAQDPVTGKPLLTVNDVLRVVSSYDASCRAYGACVALVSAYAYGEANGGEVEWSDIDIAHADAQAALGEARVAEIVSEEALAYVGDDEDAFDNATVHDGDVRIHCPACGSIEQRLLGALGNLVHLRCSDCGLDHNFNATEV